MVQYIPPPDYRSLLPPLLACLPTAFVSPRPPPALLPLLSPILRQRVQHLAATAISSADSWLPLLCWESEPAQRLVDLVSESNAFELHPVSGEIDFGDVEEILYRQLDEETLQARIAVTDMGLVVIYLWCEGDQEGGGNGWRVSEVRPLESEGDNCSVGWWASMAQAEKKAKDKMMDDALREGEDNSVAQGGGSGVPTITGEEEGEHDDDDYWAQYDQTPGGRTPAAKSPGPSTTMNIHARMTSEADYYAQYAQVQPEMDNDDPSENRESFGESSLNGDVITSSAHQSTPPELAPFQGSIFCLPSELGRDSADLDLKYPAASSPRTRSTTISRLEETAESQSMAEVAVKQHISTSIKSLFRLCRSTGVERLDFDRMVRTELETLSMMTEDD
ncbi:hypothetical protein OEA41_010302 [Lepraria neglecta]|uniref:Uncharacterized protein n=1 Tax=Lepraria neglecta TaxID=209136 RepID=A0AAD9YWB4_9LECA|nr:hypothetical protein OEA41_010302 [Lepraria neglecta]